MPNQNTTASCYKNIYTCQTRKKQRNRHVMFYIPVITLLLIFSILIRKATTTNHFTPPEFDSQAVSGTPSTEEALGFQYLDISEKCTIGICGSPYIQDNELFLYFTNPVENDVWIMTLFMEGENIIGKSGVLKPGEFVVSIPINQDIHAVDLSTVSMKIIAYEPETYQSRGSITLIPNICTVE